MRQKILILHGAVGSKKRFDKLASALETDFDIFRMNFSGHGGESLPSEPFSIELFCRDVIDFMNSHQLRSINIFGYSMGGFVALYLASHFPERVSKIVTLGTKFNWTRTTVRQQLKFLDPAIIKEKLPTYAEELRSIHHPNNWEDVLSRTVKMMKSMGRKNPLSEDDLRKLEIPVLIGMGDRDNVVIIEESVYSYRLLKKGQLFIIPNTPHPIHNVNTEVLSGEIRRFMKSEQGR